ncbi:MAG: hypothetical protein L0H02_04730 [Yaniella sp.]|nr:hypothetical protein [Yaniella sp.]
MDELSSGYPTPKRRSNGRGACPDVAPPTEGSTALALNPSWRTNPTMRVRRPSRAQETSALHRGRALLQMQATLATSQASWLRQVDEWIDDLDMRSDGRENRRRLARVLGFNADWKSLTTNTLTWGTISERTGMARATVARHLLALHEAGWIGRVASGRSAAAKQAAGWKGDDAFLNDAPVYALTEPTDNTSVDINETPPTVSGYKEFPAREADDPTGAASRPSPPEAVSDRQWTVPADRTAPAWDRDVTPSGKDQRVQAGREWARRVPALNRLSDRYLAFLGKEFFSAGWTVRDLMTALDTLPDGRAQGQLVEGRWVPYTGADGIPRARLAHWVNWRLNHWRKDGQVRESPSQRHRRRALARENQRAAQRRAQEEQRAEIQRDMATPEGQEAKARAMAQMTRNLPRRRPPRRLR